METPFVKMHGLGNDFVLLDHLDLPLPLTPRQAAFLADRRRGVGCDQVVRLVPPADPAHHARMEIFNPDGSQAEMCGNAMRCVALHLREHRGMAGPELAVETLAGIIRPRLLAGGRIAVDMGPPQLEGLRIPTTWVGPVVGRELIVGQTTLSVTALSMGNPHCVAFTPDAPRFPLATLGPQVEHHPAFPNRVNFEVVQVLDRHRLRMRVWERGAGITPACGTGACAAAVAAVLNGLCDRQVTLLLDGGELEINWQEKDNRVIMTGPATRVFQGRISVPPV